MHTSIALWIAVSLVSATGASTGPERKPNIVVILADDLGIECLSSYGGRHETPNIDKLVTQGMRFSHCFSNPYCSPSRANLLTGRYPFRNGVTTVLWSRRQEEIHVSPEQPSFARQLKAEGYATSIVLRRIRSRTPKSITIFPSEKTALTRFRFSICLTPSTRPGQRSRCIMPTGSVSSRGT